MLQRSRRLLHHFFSPPSFSIITNPVLDTPCNNNNRICHTSNKSIENLKIKALFLLSLSLCRAQATSNFFLSLDSFSFLSRSARPSPISRSTCENSFKKSPNPWNTWWPQLLKPSSYWLPTTLQQKREEDSERTMSPCNKGASTRPPRPINQTLTGSTKTKEKRNRTFRSAETFTHWSGRGCGRRWETQTDRHQMRRWERQKRKTDEWRKKRKEGKASDTPRNQPPQNAKIKRDIGIWTAIIKLQKQCRERGKRGLCAREVENCNSRSGKRRRDAGTQQSVASSGRTHSDARDDRVPRPSPARSPARSRCDLQPRC